jgi:hypothetical protein
MNLDQTFSILFRLRREKKTSDGLVPIWIRVTVDGQRAEVAAKKKILEEHWDVLTSRANSLCPNAKILNDYLNNVEAEICEVKKFRSLYLFVLYSHLSKICNHRYSNLTCNLTIPLLHDIRREANLSKKPIRTWQLFFPPG